MKNQVHYIYCSTRLIYFLFFFVFSRQSTKAQAYSSIIYDQQLSQNFGALNLITLHQGLYTFEDHCIRDTLFRENNFGKKLAGFGYRFTKLTLLDAEVDGFIALSQHEVFGHGSRFREFGYEKNMYHLNLWFPFGNGSGFSQSGNLKIGQKTTSYQENITINIAGVESELLLANNLSYQMLLNDSLHYRQGLLYSITQNNLLLYIWSTRYTTPVNIKTGNDMVNYMNGVNYLYPRLNGNYNINKLSLQSLVSLANPMQLYSLISVLYAYCAKGKKYYKIPMIKFGNLSFLPALNYSLSPFGSQFHVVNYFKYKHLLLSADVTIGDNTFNRFYGLSLKGFNIIDYKKLGLNIHADIWNQPELELETYTPHTFSNKIGEAIKIDLMYRPLNQINKIGLFLQLGYKTKGYVLGESLSESFIFRGGLSMRILQ